MIRDFWKLLGVRGWRSSSNCTRGAVCVLGSTPKPDGAFVVQAVRGLLGETDAILREGRILLCDRDPNWTSAMETVLNTVGVRVVRTPPASPNCNAHAERFVRAIKEECLDRALPLGEWHLRRLVREYVTHYHAERAPGDRPCVDRSRTSRSRPRGRFDAANESAGFSATTIVPHTMVRPLLGHYGLMQR